MAAIALAWAATADSQSKIEVFKLDPRSPLASDGRQVFAVADGGRALLAGSGSAGDWRLLAPRPTRGRIKGLAFGRGALYLSDDETKAVYRLRPGAEEAEILFKGPPLVEPAELAFSEALLVADPGAGAVFRIDLATRAAHKLADRLPPGPIHVAAERGDFAVASPEGGEIREPAAFERGSYFQHTDDATVMPLNAWRTGDPGPPAVGGGATRGVPQRRYPLIRRPSAVTLARGNLYFIDAGSPAVYVSFRQQSRPVRLVAGTQVKQPTRLLVLGDSLLVLDGSRGVLERWPLSLPTEFDLGRRPGVALDALHAYLFENRLLPTQAVAWNGTVGDTLRDAGVALGAPSPALESLFCALNPGACQVGAAAPSRREVLVPDVPTESVIDYETVSAKELEGRTLGEELDRRVVSPAFADYKDEKEVWNLNESALLSAAKSPQRGRPVWRPGAGPLRDVRGSDLPPTLALTLPVEKARCLVALPRGVLREDYGLSKIRLLSAGFNWNPMEEVEAKGYWIEPQDPPVPASPPVPCDMPALKQKHAELRDIIHFKGGAGATVFVGVAEQQAIDVHHPIFQGPDQSFSLLPGQSFPPAPAPPVPAPSCREMTERDHGTAVAGLIAGRGDAGGFTGLAPSVRVVPLRSNDADIGEDIASAFRNRSVRIFNLSLHYRDQVPVNVRQRINQFNQALFVVSAGNDATDGKPVCESVHPYPAYPVCEGHRRNVLVVAATNPAGDALIERSDQPPAPGSNWNERLVQIAAPGTGYHGPGRDNSYVAVRGTSFATPLVTATAAMLFAQGVKDPWLLKQRIVATADIKDSLRGKVHGAGLLNVARAVTEPSRAVLTCDTGEKAVEIEPGELTIKWTSGAGGSRTLPLASVRRLTRSPTGQSYRIVYLDDVTDSLVIQEEVEPGDWPVDFWNLDPAGSRVPPIDSKSLEDCRDYVGPIL